MSYIPGFDLSSIDTISPTIVPQGTGFVALRAIRQNGLQDIAFNLNYHALRDHRPEIVRIPYLFLNWYKPGADQAKLVLDLGINFQGHGTGPIAIDLEADSDSEIENYIIHNRTACIKIVNDCIAYLRSSPLYNRQDIIIYSNDSFIKDTIAHQWPDTIFWVASYQDNPPPFLPGWEWDIWQNAQYGRLDGTYSNSDSSYGSLDLDKCRQPQAWLNKLGNIV